MIILITLHSKIIVVEAKKKIVYRLTIGCILFTTANTTPFHNCCSNFQHSYQQKKEKNLTAFFFSVIKQFKKKKNAE